MPSRTRFSLLFVSLALLAAGGCAPEHDAVAPAPPKVTVQAPEARQITDHAEYNGWIGADQTVEVRARVRGHIDKVHFADGNFVKKGDVLFELDPRPFQADLDRAKDQTRIYEAQHVAAVKEAARQRELLSKGGASLSVVEKAEADAKSLEAQIAASHEEVKRRELDLDYSQVKAELTGKVGKALLQEGNLVNAGGSDPLLTTIVSVDPVRVYFSVDERTLVQFAKNMGREGKNLTDLLANLKNTKTPITFALDGETEFGHDGVLAFGDNQIDPSTGTLAIYGTVANKDGAFLPGSRVRVRIPVGKAYTALLVPETAILADQNKRYVLVAAAQDNKVERRNVTLGVLTDDGFRAIKPEGKPDPQDPPETWRVLVDNLQRARLNYPIDPQTPSSTAAEKPAAETPAAETPAAKAEPAKAAKPAAPQAEPQPAAPKAPDKSAPAEKHS